MRARFLKAADVCLEHGTIILQTRAEINNDSKANNEKFLEFLQNSKTGKQKANMI